MIKTIMKCPVCGKEFVTEYWEGGYIDHVSNWVDNYKIKLNRLNNLDDIINDLTISSLNYRDEKDIIERKNCFIKWLRKQKVSEDIIKEIEERTLERLKHIADVNNDVKLIKKIINKYENDLDREHIKRKI